MRTWRETVCGRNLGFSLIEVVLVLFLMGVILMIVSRLIGRTFETLRYLEEKGQTVQSATLGLERLSSELREAVAVTTATGSTAVFQKVEPNAPYALDYDKDTSPNANPGDPDPSIAPWDWSLSYGSDAFNVNHLGTVSYIQQGDVLVRTASKGSQSNTADVATNVNAFDVLRAPTLSNGRPSGNNTFRISLSLTEQRRVETFETIVLVPGLDP